MSQTSRGAVSARIDGGRVSKAAKAGIACTLCRQQKLRCDADNQSQSCSRCAKAGVPCVMSSSYKRGKTRSKAEMQQEIERLQNLASLGSNNPNEGEPVDRTENPTPSQSGGIMNTPISQSAVQASVEPQTIVSHPLVPPTPASGHLPVSAASPTSVTSSRSLGGVAVSGSKVDDCFSLFFRNYYPMMPVLDPTCSPDNTYQLSPFVFWCVIITGARRYDLDPTILDRLSPAVRKLASSCLFNAPSCIPTILAFAILSTWPLPMANVCDDSTPLYSGANLQLALQNGLHMPKFRQDANAGVGTMGSLTQQASLARIWAYVEFVCHCTSWSAGLPPHNVTDVFDLEMCNEDSFVQSLPRSVHWMQKFDKVMVSATSVLMDITSASSGQNAAVAGLEPLIRHFDDQILDISHKASMDVFQDSTAAFHHPSSPISIVPNPLIVTIARIYINAFHFFTRDGPLFLARLINLLDISCQWTQQADDIDRTTDWAFFSSESYFRLMTLVACIILRISHSSLTKTSIDYTRAEKCFFTITRLMKKRSLQAMDVNMSTARALSRLWHSSDFFMLTDGTCDSLRINGRGRGVVAIVHECLSTSSSRAGTANPPLRDGGDARAMIGLRSDPSPVEPFATFDEMGDVFASFTNELSFDFIPENVSLEIENSFWA